MLRTLRFSLFKVLLYNPENRVSTLKTTENMGKAVTNIKTTLFCVITQREVLIPYGRFGTAYRFHLQEQRIQKKHMDERGEIKEK
jgi:hypothetical protein